MIVIDVIQIDRKSASSQPLQKPENLCLGAYLLIVSAMQ